MPFFQRGRSLFAALKHHAAARVVRGGVTILYTGTAPLTFLPYLPAAYVWLGAWMPVIDMAGDVHKGLAVIFLPHYVRLSRRMLRELLRRLDGK